MVKEVPTTTEGDVDLNALKQMVGSNTAGIMLTNPSTLGVFERKIQEILLKPRFCLLDYIFMSQMQVFINNLHSLKICFISYYPY